MEYLEAPGIQLASRRHQYSPIKWLSKAKFEEMQQRADLRDSIRPYIQDTQPYLDSRVYVGRTSDANTSEGVQHLYTYWCKRNRLPTNLDIMGSVVRNEIDGKWELHVSHNSTEFVIKNDFWVLVIEDDRAYEWKKTRANIIPPNALRGCIDWLTNEYFYIGRTRPYDTQSVSKPQFLRGEWQTFEEMSPHRFGKVHVSHKCLYVGFNSLELRFVEYDVLCLRPSPAPLSILARTYLRHHLGHSNERIARINSPKKNIPDNLLHFLKYPSYLATSEYMIRNERIVSADGKYELLIDPHDRNKLKCRSLIRDSDVASLSPSELSDLRDTQVENLISDQDVDSIWLHRTCCVLYCSDGRLNILRGFYQRPPDYKMTIGESSRPPGIKFLNESGDTDKSDDENEQRDAPLPTFGVGFVEYDER